MTFARGSSFLHFLQPLIVVVTSPAMRMIEKNLAFFILFFFCKMESPYSVGFSVPPRTLFAGFSGFSIHCTQLAKLRAKSRVRIRRCNIVETTRKNDVMRTEK